MVRHASPAAPAAVWAVGRDWPWVVPRAVRRLALALAWLGRAVEVPWIAYPALLVLQVEVAWGDWRGRDLTPGDTADAFVLAFGWFTALTVNIVRSPLYTAFYGSLLHLTSDVPTITALHRWLIVLAADLLLLALLRRLVAAGIAWLVAAWWTLLLSTYGVTYEVHLFGALPLLLAAFLATRDRWQGAALAVLFGGALLVRNELVVPWALFGLACLFAAWRGRGAVLSRDVALEYGAPLAVVVLATCFFFSRSIVGFPGSLDELRAKHTLNVCQVYAFGYAERHPEWPNSPWTECDGLMVATFGAARPTLLEAAARNPGALLAQVAWSLRLVPNGLEYALFNAASGTVSPDFAQVRTGEPVPKFLLGALALMIVTAVWCSSRDASRGRWARLPARGPRAWLVVVAGAVGAGVVLLVERPRAEYIYGLTLLLLAAAGLSAETLATRWAWSRRWLAAGVGLVLLVLPLVPLVWSPSADSAQKLLSAYRQLKPYQPLIADPSTRFLKGAYNGAIGAYLGHRADGVFDYSILDETQPMLETLDKQHITLVYLDDARLTALEDDPTARPLLDSPESVGWRLIGLGEAPAARWRLLARDSGGERRDSNARPSEPQSDALTS